MSEHEIVSAVKIVCRNLGTILNVRELQIADLQSRLKADSLSYSRIESVLSSIKSLSKTLNAFDSL